MKTGPVIAFARRHPEVPGLEVRINFGMLAGRDATSAELDELAHRALAVVSEVSVVGEQRHAVAEHSEAELHQVRLEVADDLLPESEEDVQALSDRLVEEAIRWTDACLADRQAEVLEI